MAKNLIFSAFDLLSSLETDLEHARYMNDNLLDDFFGHCEIEPLEQNKIIHHYNDARIEGEIIAHLLYDIDKKVKVINKILEKAHNNRRGENQ